MKFFEKKQNIDKIKIIILILGIILGVIACRYHADKFLIDDMLSFSLSNTPGGWVGHEVLGWISNNEFKRFAVIDNPFDYVNVFNNQAADCHPPFYYMIIHTISSVFKGKLSYWYGYIPNIIFYLLSSIMVEKITFKITNKRYFSLLAMLLFIINPKVLEYVAFIRMYPLVGLFALCFVYAAMSFFNIKEVKIKTYVLLIFITALGCLTHYYSYVIYFFFSIVVGLTLLLKKHFKELILYSLSILSGIGLALIIFPQAITHWLTNAHSVNAINNLGESVGGLQRYITYIETSPLKYLSVVLLVIILAFNFKFKKLRLENFALIFTVVMYFLLIGKTSSFITHRYMVPIDGLLVCAIIAAVGMYLDDIKHILIVAAVLILYSGIPNVYIADYKNPISFSKAHYCFVLVVYSDQYLDCNYINVNSFEFREYENIYLMNNSEEARSLKADFFLYDKAIIYVAHEMDLESVKNWLFGSSRFNTLESTGIKTSLYEVYYAR